MEEFQLKAFVYAADFSSLSKASLFLRVSQPTISRNIRQLEEQLNTTLLVRHGRGVVVTDDGARFLDHAKAILNCIEGATRDLVALRKEPEGVVSLGMPTAVGTVLLPSITRRVKTELPKVSLIAYESGSVELFEWLLDGRLDVAVIHEPDAQSNVIIEEVWNQEIFLVGAAESRLSGKTALPLEEIAELPLILPMANRPPRRGFEEAMRAAGLPVNCIIEVNSAQLMRSLAIEGLGYTILPLPYVLDDVAAKRLTAAKIGGAEVKESLNIVTTTFHPASAATRMIARMVSEEFRSLANKKFGGVVELVSGPGRT
jgi:LysR family transcriptional regulator, nitrogen assimilation regulatory protein